MITFGGLAPFEENDLNGNFEKLMRSAGLWDEDLSMEDNEKKVGEHIAAFFNGESKTEVQAKKYKSALFIAYLSHMRHNTKQEYQNGEEFMMSSCARELTELYFGKDLMDHEVPTALMEPGAVAQVVWKRAA